jgi:cysteine-rich repeat protein
MAVVSVAISGACSDGGGGGSGDSTSEGGADTTSGPGTESSGSSGPVTGCGDGVVDPDEACDDGNDVDGDGCNRDCVVSGSVLWQVSGDYVSCRDFHVSSDAGGSIYTAVGRYVNATSEMNDAKMARLDPVDGANVWEIDYEHPTAVASAAGPVFGLRGGEGAVFLVRTGDGSYVQSWDAAGTVVWEQLLADAMGVPATYEAAAIDDEDGVWIATGVFAATWTVELQRVVAGRGVAVQAQAGTVVDFGPAFWRAATTPALGVVMLGVSEPASVRAYGPDGAMGWTDEFADESAWDAAVAPDGTVHVTFMVDGASRVLVRSFAPDGTVQGELSHDVLLGDGNDRQGEIAVDDAGNLVVAAMESTTDAAQGNLVTIAKYDAGGTPLWGGMVTESGGFFELCDVHGTEDGGVLVAVTTLSAPAAGEPGRWIFRFAP